MLQIRGTILLRPPIIWKHKGTQSFVKEKPLHRAWEALPEETSAPQMKGQHTLVKRQFSQLPATR